MVTVGKTVNANGHFGYPMIGAGLAGGDLARIEPRIAAAPIDAPDSATRTGRRDRAILTVMAQIGLRVSQLIGLKIGGTSLEPGAHLRCFGKGRKERITPLRKDSVAVLRNWLRERQGGGVDPRARVLTLADAGHITCSEQPEAIAAALRGWGVGSFSWPDAPRNLGESLLDKPNLSMLAA
ncbi:MAG: tyrosine-type recombinase/integrase [Rhodobacteraceae bacterium]|jgi:integrase|nr:tyrosine-type recombinase/integrase [Paracoccaceae bacterium]